MCCGSAVSGGEEGTERDVMLDAGSTKAVISCLCIEGGVNSTLLSTNTKML